MFFEHNKALGPPYNVLLDTNFINFSIQHKLDIFKSLMDCLVAKATPCISDCVIAELEKMGHRFRLALKLTKDPRFKKLTCIHKGTYADDCIMNTIK
jgi:U3 small nucleolar RNA-associated protein 24